MNTNSFHPCYKIWANISYRLKLPYIENATIKHEELSFMNVDVLFKAWCVPTLGEENNLTKQIKISAETKKHIIALT